jgi:plastocyanin
MQVSGITDQDDGGFIMHRVATIAAIGLCGAVVALTAAAPAFAAETTSTPAPSPSTSTTTTSTTTTTPSASTASPATTSTTTTTAAGSVAVARRAARSLALPTPVPAARAHAASNLTITISSNCTYFCYVPQSMSVAVGDTVTWMNKSSAPHTVTRCTPAACNGASAGTGTDASFTSGDIGAASGATFSHTFSQPGTYVYYCKIHGYALMHGTITVTAATTTTAAPAPTAAPTTPAAAPAPTPAGAHQLASTGGNSTGVATIALILIACGLTATSFEWRRRSSSSARW